jgi:hypothetical protein
MPEVTCPVCHAGSLVRGEGRLEQSGDSYLPTVVWSCALCEYRQYEPATGAHWRSAAEPAADAQEPEAAPARARRQAA